MTTAGRVVLADDAASIRQLVATLVGLEGFEVVGEAQNGLEAVSLVEEHLPDVIVLDISMPRLSGLEAIPLIRRGSPGTKIVMLSAFATDDMRAQALALGASDFLEKRAIADEIVPALRRAMGAEA
jgi:two-component system chemotaxis response regulator CheY